MATAVIPLKRFACGKGRLSPICSEQERMALTQAMVHDTLTKLLNSGQFEEVYIVSQEPALSAWLLENKLSVKTITDERDCSLNASFVLAAHHLSPFCDAMLFLHGDLPLMQERDIGLLLDPLKSRRVVLAADNRRSGTNAIAVKLPLPLLPQFGENSLYAHQTYCLEQGIPHSLVYHERIGFDVDTPDDLLALPKLLSPRTEPHTWNTVKQLSCFAQLAYAPSI